MNSNESLVCQPLTKVDSINIDKVHAMKKLYREIRKLNSTIEKISIPEQIIKIDSINYLELKEEITQINNKIQAIENQNEPVPIEEKQNNSFWFWLIGTLIFGFGILIGFFVKKKILKQNQ